MGAEVGLRQHPPELSGYRQEVHERIPIRRVSVASILTIPAWTLLFMLAGLPFLELDGFALTITLTTILMVLAVTLVLVPVLHEIMHGLVALAVGARPFFGVGEGFAYTSFREPVSRNAYLAITIAPLAVLSLGTIVVIAFFPGVFGYAVAFGAVNAAGSAGDLWMLGKVWRLPPDARIYDLADGYAAYVPDCPESMVGS
jgi:hypothetical protein